ncbi:MAG TPA: MBL fold metallo-hydrolase, partial [Candidatus Aenigmarchaeota archaeon]|nr:MBL fold metallo-hydrolase [Candidatus Aenigmarchaeota archaeon]
MEIIPLAFDSLGTRSMSTFVETDDVKILIDPGVSLAPMRFGYPPHPVEIERMKQHWNKIIKYAKNSDILIITHYHHDHYNPEEKFSIYKDKTVFVKHPEENINLSQKGRAADFLGRIKNLPERLEYSDGREFRFGKTRVVFSEAVEHGTNSRLGYVTEVLIDDGYRFVHTSDVEGPSLDRQAEFILKNKPNLVIIDGPLSTMLGFRYSYNSLNASIENMIRIVKKCPLDSLV